MKVTSVERTGAFEIAGLPPGQCQVAVMADPASAAGDGQMRWPDFLHDLVRDAQEIAIGEGQRVPVTLRGPGV